MTSDELRKKYLVFLDLETTDLDPASAVPLEVGAILVDASSLETMVTFTALIQPQGRCLENMPDVVHEMHTNNGLLQDIKDPYRMTMYPTLAVAMRYFEDMVHAWLQHRGEVAEDSSYVHGQWVTLAGHAIWFDRTFLRSYAPEFEADCHHVMVDVSSIRHMARIFFPEAVRHQDLKHRALQDCYSALEEMRLYKTALLGVLPKSYFPK